MATFYQNFPSMYTCKFSLLFFSSFAPHVIQFSLDPNDIAPQLWQVVIFDLKELKPKNANSNNKRGIKNKSNKTLPRNPKRKFTPKIGIIINTMKEKVKIFLLIFKKEFILDINTSLSSFIH